MKAASLTASSFKAPVTFFDGFPLAGPSNGLLASRPSPFASVCLSAISGPRLVFELADAAKAASVEVNAHTYKVFKVKPDGRCMFRSIAQGLAHNKKIYLNGPDEEREADLLRTACYDAICRDNKRAREFKDAVQ